MFLNFFFCHFSVVRSGYPYCTAWSVNQGHLLNYLWESWEELELKYSPIDSVVSRPICCQKQNCCLETKFQKRQKLRSAVPVFSHHKTLSPSILKLAMPIVSLCLYDSCFSHRRECQLILSCWPLLSFRLSQLVIVLSRSPLKLSLNCREQPDLQCHSCETAFLVHFFHDEYLCKQSVSSLDNEDQLQTLVGVSAPRLTAHFFLRHTISLWCQARVGLPNTPR